VVLAVMALWPEVLRLGPLHKAGVAVPEKPPP